MPNANVNDSICNAVWRTEILFVAPLTYHQRPSYNLHYCVVDGKPFRLSSRVSAEQEPLHESPFDAFGIDD